MSRYLASLPMASSTSWKKTNHQKNQQKATTDPTATARRSVADWKNSSGPKLEGQPRRSAAERKPKTSLTARAGAPIRELKQFQELVKRDCAELAYCEGIAISTKHYTFWKLPMFSTKVTERFKINPDPIGKDGGATRHQFSPTGETVTYTAQAAELWITDGRSLTPAAEVLEHAFQWWRKFFDEMSTL